MQGALSQGSATKHVQSSRGADCNLNNFYVTEYSTNHGKEGYIPRKGKAIGTGWMSNFRPGLYYSRKLDEFDNPSVGQLLADNYSSSNKLQFPSLISGANGKDRLPKSVLVKKSGFVRDIPQTHPPYNQVHTACYDDKYLSKEKHPPSHLFQLKNKSPINTENNYHGPGFMTTENHTRFVKQTTTDYSEKKFGPKEGSGFTHAQNIEPITYFPNECFSTEDHCLTTWRPTASSVMKMSYKTMEGPQGSEGFSHLSKQAVRLKSGSRDISVLPAFAAPKDTYTKTNEVHPLTERRIEKNDPAEFLNMKHAKYFPSMTYSTFRGEQPNENLFFKSVRHYDKKKENTGFSQNNRSFVESVEMPEELKRFNSHYKDRFYNKNPESSSSLPRNEVLKQLSNGFTKSTAVHSHEVNSIQSRGVKELHPYVTKSISSRYPYDTNDTKYTRT